MQGTGSLQAGVDGKRHVGPGVNGASTSGPGLSGSSNSAPGVYGSSKKGRGGMFSGGSAPLNLQPSTAGSHPKSGRAGDLLRRQAQPLFGFAQSQAARPHGSWCSWCEEGCSDRDSYHGDVE